MNTPAIAPDELRRRVIASFPEAKVTLETVNEAYSSWRIDVQTEAFHLEFVWGPLSGFGVIDWSVENPNPFAYCDVWLNSIEEAQQYLTKASQQIGAA